MRDFDPTAILAALAVARQGSLSKAASTLGVSQPTLGRQIQQLEEAVGYPLFVRHARGMRPTGQAEALLEAARGLERALESFARAARAGEDEVRGDVRVAASEIVGVEVLAPALPRLRLEHPGLHVELVLGNRAADLERGEADLAVRMFQPRGLDLMTRRVGAVPTALFAQRDYLARRGHPTTLDALLEHTLIGFELDSPMARTFEAFDARLTPRAFALRTDSLSAQLAMARHGAGVAVLQCPIAARYPELVALPLISTPDLPVWLTTHSDLRRAPDVRATWAWLIEALEGYLAKARASGARDRAIQN